MNQINGLDISFWQGTSINWQQVADAGYQFVYIKASEGCFRVEPNANTQATGAQAASLKIGYYHFSHPSEDKAVDEANFFLKAIKNLPQADLIPVLDLETNKNNLTIEQMTQFANDFYTQMQNNGFEMMLYTYTSFYNSFIVGKDLLQKKLWLASYGSSPILPIGRSDYEIWQWTQKGSIPGISGSAVDLNICPDLSQILIQ
jgi:lysozyme